VESFSGEGDHGAECDFLFFVYRHIMDNITSYKRINTLFCHLPVTPTERKKRCPTTIETIPRRKNQTLSSIMRFRHNHYYKNFMEFLSHPVILDFTVKNAVR